MIDDASLLMLGNLAIEKGILIHDQLEAALTEQHTSQLVLGEILLKRELITRNQLKILLDIHNLKIFYHENLYFGFLAIANSLTTEALINKALEIQKATSPHQYIGEILIQLGALKLNERDSLLKTQKRLTFKQTDQEQTFVKCPYCEQSYRVVDSDRYRKVRCKTCTMVFEVGVIKQEIKDVIIEPPLKTTKLEINTTKKKEANNLQSLSSFLLHHQIESNIALETRADTGFFSNNRKYVFGAEIARGGMGSIVETTDTDIKRQVVTKILLRNDSKEAIVKFIEEAQITGQLEHPNIVPVYDLGINDEGLVYFTMKRVRGQTLLKIIEKLRKKDKETIAKYNVTSLIEIFLKVCDGVAFAHQKGVIHRDLKPENIMVGEFGEVLTMDWGLAKILGKPVNAEKIENLDNATLKTIRNDQRNRTKTLQGTIAGTPEYMSPEQAKGLINQLTIASDIYSLGGVLYTIVEHRLPVEGKNHQETINRVSKGQLNDFSEETSSELISIIKKTMSYSPEERYPNVNALKEDLHNYLKGYSVSAKEDTFFEVSIKWVRRNHFLSLGIGAILVTLTIFFIVVLIMGNRNTNNKLEALQKARLLEEQEKANALDRQKSAPSILDAARNLVFKKQYKEAKEKVNLVIDFAPDLPDTYFYKGLLDFYAEDYNHAIQDFKLYEDKVIYQNKPQYPTISVNKLMKNLYRMQEVGINTVDFFEIKDFFERNELLGFVEITEKKISQLITRYENILYSIDPKLELKIKNGGVALNFKKMHVKHTALKEIKTIPVIEADFENSELTDISFINTVFLKKLILNNCLLENYSQIENFRSLEWLELADTKITNIQFLENLKLQGLSLSHCNISDLSLLQNMPITNLDITSLPVQSLSFTQAMPLVALHMGGTSVKDLSPLINKKIEWLSIWQTSISSLKAVRGQPLLHLDIENTPIMELSELLDSKIERLYVNGDILTDKNISIINRLHLKFLSIKDFKESNLKSTIENVTSIRLIMENITELNKLNFQNVLELDLGQCSGLKSIKGVTTLTTLEKITLPTDFKNFSPITSLPALNIIVTAEYGQQAASTFFKMLKKP